jgi:threonine dehydrogenase-like Zn-dependent dehydrogenase
MAETMRGVVFRGDCRAEVREFPIPAPGPGQVLVRLRRAAVCGSDLHVYRQPASYFEGKAPWIPGHEPAGDVVALGPGCERVSEGARVTIYHWLGCGHCRECRRGYYQFCDQRRGLGQPNAVGPDADYIVVDERNCLLLPEALSYEDGAFIACIAGTGYSAMRKLCCNGEDTVLVTGQGPVGLVGDILVKAMGARVVAVDLVPERLALADAVGADAIVNAATEDVSDAIRELTGGRGVSAAYETSGSAAGRLSVIDGLRVQGRAAFVGIGAQEPSLPAGPIIGKELTIMGSFVMPIGYYWDLVAFMLRHELSAQFDRIVTHRYRLEDAAEAFAVADEGRCGKVMLVWD